ncbi:hypothetical protein PSYPI_36894, partial [Pseudomonas syringae pv. pisi str. 1704B]
LALTGGKLYKLLQSTHRLRASVFNEIALSTIPIESALEQHSFSSQIKRLFA